VAILRTFLDDLERANSDERKKEAAMGRALQSLGGRAKVNAADIVWYARLLDKTGSTDRLPRRTDGGRDQDTRSYDQRKLPPERVALGEGGRLVIPASYRRVLSWNEGEDLILRLEDGELRILTPQQGLNRAQALVREHVPAGRSLADELIAERRQEASDE
jgi:bifunctional DNA-binding transcriptional regulator/antitoxin component of YhaV-PrlF toxin-antitoxin module